MAVTGKFKFWCPLEISKAKNDSGEEIMRLGGIASTMDKDADGEFLDPSGFDITDFVKSGVVNWHHQSKNSPATIIGEPFKAEVRKDGFYVETDLYKSSELAQEVYGLAMTMASDSKTRRLGYSIEGTVIERDEVNPKIVKKAMITGLAITHMPKNVQTFADIIKGHGHIQEDLEDDEEEKSISTTSDSALVPESVDGYKVKKLTPEVMYDKIFDTFSGISIEKAEKVFEFLNKIEIAMAKGKIIENQDIEKAMSHLGLDSLDGNPFLEKAKKSNPTKDKSEMTDQEVADAVERENYETDEEDEDKKDDKDKKSEEEDEPIKKGTDSESLNKSEGMEAEQGEQILKAIQTGNDANTANVRALAQLVKAQMDTTDAIQDSLNRTRKDLTETRKDLTKALGTIERLGGQSRGRKSLTKGYVERKFSGEDNLEKGEKGAAPAGLSVTNHKPQILEILDKASFAKGFDEEFSKALTGFEAGNELTANVIARLKNEHGVNIQR